MTTWKSTYFHDLYFDLGSVALGSPPGGFDPSTIVSWSLSDIVVAVVMFESQVMRES